MRSSESSIYANSGIPLKARFASGFGRWHHAWRSNGLAHLGRRLDEVVADVTFHHGEVDGNVPPQYAKELAERIQGSRLHLHPGEGHISILDKPIQGIVETLIAP